MSVHSFKLASLTSVLAALSGAAATFLVFRVGVLLLGRDIVGCWALVQGLMIIARIADGGVSSNITRLAAIRRSEPETMSIGDFLFGGLLLATTPVIIIGTATIYPIMLYIHHRFGGFVSSIDTLEMTLASFGCGVFGSLSGASLALIEGLGCLVYRNVIAIVSSLAMALSAWPLVHYYGVVGFGLTNLVPVVVQLVLSCAFFAVGAHASKPASSAGMRAIVREIWRASLSLSFIGVLRLSYEPVTKLLMSMNGSLSSLASFDLALRVSTNVRGLFQSAIQPLLVAGSRTTRKLESDVGLLYAVSNIQVYKLSVLFAAGQFAAGPILSQMGFGRVDYDFVLFFACIVAANAVNALGIVGYYFQLSCGHMRPLIVVQTVMLFINLSMGYVGGLLFGSIGIVGAYAVTFAFGGLAGLRLWLDHEEEGVWHFLMQHAHAVGWTVLALSLLLTFQFQNLRDMGGPRSVVLTSLAACLLIGAITFHQIILMRKRVDPALG
jgi:hypothetical protein